MKLKGIGVPFKEDVNNNEIQLLIAKRLDSLNNGKKFEKVYA